MSRLVVASLQGPASQNYNVIMPTGSKLVQSGGVIQVVQVVKTDTFATSVGAVWGNISGMSASIIPTSSTSKILVIVDLKAAGTCDASTMRTRLLRNGNPVYVGDAASTRPQAMCEFYMASGGGPYYTAQVGGTYLDSPGTTSIVTYSMQIGGDNNSSVLYVNRTQGDRDNQYYDARVPSSITLMEIGG